MVGGSVRFRPSFPPTSWCVRALSVSGVCSVVRPVKLSSGSTVMYADHERCVCALLCASGVALHNLCGFESIQNLPGEWMIRSTTAGMGMGHGGARALTHRETAALARIPGLLTRHSPHK